MTNGAAIWRGTQVIFKSHKPPHDDLASAQMRRFAPWASASCIAHGRVNWFLHPLSKKQFSSLGKPFSESGEDGRKRMKGHYAPG
jgi:hypothetical protein